MTPTHPCFQCGYDLRGTPVDGVCPECGLAAMVSQERWNKRPAQNRAAWWTIIFVGIAYLVFNILGLKSQFIPGMNSFFAYGFILPTCLGFAGIVFSITRFGRRRDKIIGSLTCVAVSILFGWANVALISAIWASI